MAGERILIIDPSAAVQEIAQNTLAEAGYRVRTASNGMSALVSPEIKDFDIVILDTGMDGVDGYTTARELKSDADTFQTLVLLLVDEAEVEKGSDPPLRGANGYIKKPFDPANLVHKIRSMIEERELEIKTRAYLDEAANKLMSQLAEEHISKAVENKTQLIVERAIQNVVSKIDQRATVEVDQRVTQLTAEKEQELVRMTVHEVAKSMVEKLAERKVAEAIETILREVTEKTVKRSVERTLPSQIRDRVKENLEIVLPREIQGRMEQAVKEVVPELFSEMSRQFESVAQKTVQKAARERLPEIIDRQLEIAINTTIPRYIREQAKSEIAQMARNSVEPEIRGARRKLTALCVIFFLISLVLICGYIGLDFYGLLDQYKPHP
ncbi:response regulator [Candidatus Sumerlaeota bacterium]|nr:response regulator [Candidatus Sumerlaeota bacterium]